MKILHIAPHLGGGVGRFCSNVYGKDNINQHIFLLLEQPIDLRLISSLSWTTLDDLNTNLDQYLQSFDIIQLEYWNHPIIFKFLIECDLNKCRLVIYSHTSGLYAPNIIPPLLFDLADVVILSTPGSQSVYQQYIDNGKCVFIHGVGGCEVTSSLERKQHDGFKIAYIGTASYTKIHPGFVDACVQIIHEIPKTEFLFASNDNNCHLQMEIKDRGIKEHFKFYTKLSDISEILNIADVFGYPLRKEHFGTGEQALLEAMGGGIPPVVLNNPAEISLVKDGKTGFVAKNISEYVKLIKFCHQNSIFSNLVGKQAKSYALKNFSSSKTIESIKYLYDRVIQSSKTNHRFSSLIHHLSLNSIGWNLYKMCVGDLPEIHGFEMAETTEEEKYFRSKIMQSDILFSKNKGGLMMYRDFFQNDLILNQF